MNARALPDLAQAIDREHQAAHQAARNALDHALECGRLLIQAKAAVPHGGWLSWLEANVSFGPRQAQKYMRLAEHEEETRNATSGSHLGAVARWSLNDALGELARPDPDPFPEPEVAQEPSLPLDLGSAPSPEDPPAAESMLKPGSEPDEEHEDPAAWLIKELQSRRWPVFTPEELAAECHQPEGLRALVWPKYDALRRLLNALDARMRKVARQPAIAQPVDGLLNPNPGRRPPLR
jgi:hypothetical protein